MENVTSARQSCVPASPSCPPQHPPPRWALSLTCGQVGFLNDRLWNFPAAALLVPDGFTPDLVQVAVVAVTPDQGLHLIQQLLAEHQLSLLAPDGAQIIHLFQPELQLQVLDLSLGSSELDTKHQDYKAETQMVTTSTGICQAEKDTPERFNIWKDFEFRYKLG